MHFLFLHLNGNRIRKYELLALLLQVLQSPLTGSPKQLCYTFTFTPFLKTIFKQKVTIRKYRPTIPMFHTTLHTIQTQKKRSTHLRPHFPKS